MRTRRRALLGLLIAAGLVAPLGLPSVAQTCQNVTLGVADDWERITPQFGDRQSPSVVDVAVHPYLTKLLVATNGTVVVVSRDGGCTWDRVYDGSLTISIPEVGDTGTIGVNGRVLAVEVTHAPDTPVFYAYALLDQKPLVARSADLGRTWQTTTVGLPVDGLAGELRATADSSTTFLLVRDSLSASALGDLYVTRDAGASWNLASAALAATGVRDFVVDAADPRLLWAWDDATLSKSNDGGRTFTSVPGVRYPVSAVATHHMPASSPPVVTVFARDQSLASRSLDGGATWVGFDPGIAVRSATTLYAPGVTDEVLIYAGGGRVRMYIPTRSATPTELLLEPAELTSLRVTVVPPMVIGVTGRAIYRLALTPTFRPPAPRKRLLPKVDLTGPVPISLDSPALRPENLLVQLDPGQTRDVEYQLDVPPNPSPMDLFLATDSTGSMDDFIAGVREDFQDVINDLAAAKIDVWVGLADFKDYPVPGFGSPDDYPYRRLRAVGPIDDELRDALESLDTGGGMNEDSQLAAAYQAATGLGQAVVGQVPGAPSRWIAPGQGAEFRTGTLKVIVLAADVRAHEPERDIGYPGPSFGTVISALNRRGIHVVGLSIGDDDAARESLERVAQGTGTLAPADGVDCDNDGELDVQAGQPLVCTLVGQRREDTGVGAAIVNLLRSLRDPAPVELTVTADPAAVLMTSAAVINDVNLRAPNRLPFLVRYQCSDETAGRTFPVRLAGRTRNREVVATTATLVCGPGEPGAPPPLPPVAAAVAPAVQPPPPAPQPNANPNPNLNPNPQLQPLTAIAAEEQQQHELALAYNDLDDEGTVELAMSDRRRAPSPLPLYASAMLLSAAAGVALRRERTRLRASRQRSS